MRKDTDIIVSRPSCKKTFTVDLVRMDLVRHLLDSVLTLALAQVSLQSDSNNPLLELEHPSLATVVVVLLELKLRMFHDGVDDLVQREKANVVSEINTRIVDDSDAHCSGTYNLCYPMAFGDFAQCTRPLYRHLEPFPKEPGI
jgi:hypothetical protein